jgi:adenosylcobinamide-GDP ribazoletransferase
MKDFLEGWVLGIGYFTRIPLPFKILEVTQKKYSYLALTLPLVGFMLGMLTVGLYILFSTYSNRYFAAFLASVLYLFIYGFLHLEAVSDIVDAYYGGHSGKDRYEILKDPHIGAIGAFWGFGLLLIKVASMTMLLASDAYSAVISVLILSRLGAVWLIFAGGFHKNSLFILHMHNVLEKRDIWFVTILSFVFVTVLGYWWLCVFIGILVFGLQRWLRREFGFINGDGLGFVIEMAEVWMLTGAVLLL